jgi:catalase
LFEKCCRRRCIRYPSKIEGIRERVRGKKFQEHYDQAQLFFNSLALYEKKHLIDAFSFELDHCDDPIVYETYTKLLNCIDFELAKNVASNVGGIIPDKPGRENHGKRSDFLSQTHYVPKHPLIAGRRVAILVADDFNLDEVNAVRSALSSVNAKAIIIGPRRGEIYSEGAGRDIKGSTIRADHHFEGQRSTLFDAIFIPSGRHIYRLAENGRAIQYVKEAFGHCKAIGATGSGIAFLRDDAGLPRVQFQHEGSSDVMTSYGVVTTGKLDVKSALISELRIRHDEKDFLAEFAHVISQHRCYQREMDGLTAEALRSHSE